MHSFSPITISQPRHYLINTPEICRLSFYFSENCKQTLYLIILSSWYTAYAANLSVHDIKHLKSMLVKQQMLLPGPSRMKAL